MKFDAASVLVGAVAMTLLGGVAVMLELLPFAQLLGDPIEPCKVKVRVLHGNLVVNHEPVHKKGCPNGALLWKAAGNWKFPTDTSISLKSPAKAECFRSDNYTTIECTFKDLAPGANKYMIEIVDKNGLDPKSLDPNIIND